MSARHVELCSKCGVPDVCPHSPCDFPPDDLEAEVRGLIPCGKQHMEGYDYAFSANACPACSARGPVLAALRKQRERRLCAFHPDCGAVADVCSFHAAVTSNPAEAVRQREERILGVIAMAADAPWPNEDLAAAVATRINKADERLANLEATLAKVREALQEALDAEGDGTETHDAVEERRARHEALLAATGGTR